MPIQHSPRHRAIALMAALTLAGGALTACADSNPEGAAAVPAAPAVELVDYSFSDPSASALPAHAMAIHNPNRHRANHANKRLSAQIELYSSMRTAWDQHMQWTYATVVAFAAESPGLQPTIDRILRNQVDIGNAIAPYYGDAAAAKLTDLLSTHIKEAVPVLTAAKAGDTVALNKAVTDWYANAQDIADFLSTANTHWARRDMRRMMKAHITQTIGYASDILGGDWPKAIADYDQAQEHMDEMADMLSAGIIAQFRSKF